MSSRLWSAFTPIISLLLGYEFVLVCSGLLLGWNMLVFASLRELFRSVSTAFQGCVEGIPNGMFTTQAAIISRSAVVVAAPKLEPMSACLRSIFPS